MQRVSTQARPQNSLLCFTQSLYFSRDITYLLSMPRYSKFSLCKKLLLQTGNKVATIASEDQTNPYKAY